MAGTRFCIALIFAVQLASLLGVAVWTGLRKDLVAQWWNKATRTSSDPASLDPSIWKIPSHLWNPPIGSSLMIGCHASDRPLWQRRVFTHPQLKGILNHPWLPNLQIVAVPPSEMELICARPIKAEDDKISIPHHLAPIDLFLCKSSEDGNDSTIPERNQLRVFSDGSSRLLFNSHTDKEPDLVDFLLPHFNESLPLESCLDPRIRWEFILVNGRSSLPNWQPWAKALNEARTYDWQGGWFPLAQSNQSFSASFNAQHHSSNDWPRIQQYTIHKADNETDLAATKTTYQYILLDDLKRISGESSRSKSNEIPIYVLLSATPEPIYFIEDESDLSIFHSQQRLATVPSLVSNGDALWASLAAGGESNDPTFQIQQSLYLIQGIRNWMAQACLGWNAEAIDLVGAPTPDFRLGRALFWLRALRLSHEQAMLRAHEQLNRYKEHIRDENQRLNDFDQDPIHFMLWHGLGIRPLVPIAPNDSFQSSILAMEEAVTGLKQVDLESATRLFLRASSFQNARDHDIPLFLDLSIDQYAAIFAPLLIPLVLPAFLTFLREMKRLAQKWKSKNKKTKQKAD